MAKVAETATRARVKIAEVMYESAERHKAKEVVCWREPMLLCVMCSCRYSGAIRSAPGVGS